MDFKIGEETFSLLLLIDKKIDDPEVNRFIRAIEKSDDTYIVNEPMDEDIIDSKDKWSCHIAEKLGVLFEFSNSILCYVTLRFTPEELKKNPIPDLPDDIIKAIVIIEDSSTEYAFGSLKVFSDEKMIPGRYSLIIKALIDALRLRKQIVKKTRE
tara:strand:- start:155 stop:619 length:465 start_codon:yes stop_codon:yes gene_type:complete